MNYLQVDTDKNHISGWIVRKYTLGFVVVFVVGGVEKKPNEMTLSKIVQSFLDLLI